MRIGLQIVRFDWPGSPANIGSTLAEIARFVDTAGFDSLWVMDHFFQMGGIWGEADAPMLEGYSTLAYMAALTKNVTLGTMVTGYIYRHPGILGKTVTTLDALSGGRAWLGIGAGWYEREALGLGVPYPTTGTRFEQLEETLQIITQMWRDDRRPFAGKHFTLSEPINQPGPIQKPHPPILIGSEGEKKGLRLVAKYGNACNFHAGASFPAWGSWAFERYQNSRAHVAHKWQVLAQHCADLGRDPREIEFTTLNTIKPSRDGNGNSSQELIDYFGSLREVGVNHVIFNIPDVHTMAALEQLAADVVPAVHAMD